MNESLKQKMYCSDCGVVNANVRITRCYVKISCPKCGATLDRYKKRGSK